MKEALARGSSRAAMDAHAGPQVTQTDAALTGPASTVVYGAWLKFSSIAIPREAVMQQRVGMRTAFYSGAASLFADFVKMIDAAGISDPPQEVVDWMVKTNAELQQWQNETALNDKTFAGAKPQ